MTYVLYDTVFNNFFFFFQSDTEQSVIIGINDVEENTNNNSSAFIKFSNSSNSSITEKLYTDKKIEVIYNYYYFNTSLVYNGCLTNKFIITSSGKQIFENL